jgi:hypothetical protein
MGEFQQSCWWPQRFGGLGEAGPRHSRLPFWWTSSEVWRGHRFLYYDIIINDLRGRYLKLLYLFQKFIRLDRGGVGRQFSLMAVRLRHCFIQDLCIRHLLLGFK